MALSQAQKDIIALELKKGDLSNRSIAKLAVCSESAVRTLLKKAGIKKNGDIYKNIKRRESNIYIIKAGSTNFYKIGVANDTGERLKGLQTAHYEQLKVIRTFYSDNAYTLEKRLHQKYTDRGQRVRGEWFILCENDIRAIESICYGY